MVWNPVVSLLRMPPWALFSLGMGTVAKWQEIKQVSQLSWLAIRGTDVRKAKTRCALANRNCIVC